MRSLLLLYVVINAAFALGPDAFASLHAHRSTRAPAPKARDRQASLIREKARQAVALENVRAEAQIESEPAPKLDSNAVSKRAYELLVDELIGQVETFEVVNSQNANARVKWDEIELRLPPFWTSSAESLGPRELAQALLRGVARLIGENPEALPRVRIELPEGADPAISRAIDEALAGDAYLSSRELRGFTRIKSSRRSLERRTQLKSLAEQVRAANASVAGVRIAAHSRSSSPGQASGDFVHVEQVDGLLHILVADVAGKGKVEAVAREAVWFGSELRHSLDFRLAMQGARGEPVGPLRFVEERVRDYQRAHPDSPARQEVAATYCIYDPRTRVLKIAFGGGTSSVGIFKSDGRVTYLKAPRIVKSSNIALGLLPKEQLESLGYENARPTLEVRLEEGDLFLVTTDGYHDAPGNLSLRAGKNLNRLLEAPASADPAQLNYATFPVRKLLPDPESLIRLIREEGNLSSRVFTRSGDDTTVVAVKVGPTFWQ